MAFAAATVAVVVLAALTVYQIFGSQVPNADSFYFLFCSRVRTLRWCVAFLSFVPCTVQKHFTLARHFVFINWAEENTQWILIKFSRAFFLFVFHQNLFSLTHRHTYTHTLSLLYSLNWLDFTSISIYEGNQLLLRWCYFILLARFCCWSLNNCVKMFRAYAIQAISHFAHTHKHTERKN